MSGLNRKLLQLVCDFSRLSGNERLLWLRFIHEWIATGVRQVEIVEDVLENAVGPDSDFVLISSSGALSRKLLLSHDQILIKPIAGVAGVDAWLWSQLEKVEPAWHPQLFTVSLISSIFSGDEFIDGFLENASRFNGYCQCQHFLIRAGSRGRELEKLIPYVQEQPNTVLINLVKDPGLYEVWNIGVRLSTAKYVSNANLDDRRSPDQLNKLLQVLADQPTVDVVSSALRVTQVKNLRWEDSVACELWPKAGPQGFYTASELFREQGGLLLSRNLPHCMPVWRKLLHATVGDFDEGLYGPSADWAFWLRAATKGAGFYLVPEPLGVYLRTDAGYWQRNSGGLQKSRFDEGIVDELGALAHGKVATGYRHRPLSLQLALVQRRVETGDVLDGLGYLLEVCTEEPVEGLETALAMGRYYFGSGFNEHFLDRYRSGVQANRSYRLLDALVGLIGSAGDGQSGLSSGRVRRSLSFACADWFESESQQVGLMLMALLSKRCGNVSDEKRQLQAAYALGEESFWSLVQTVYRFERSATDLVELLGGCEVSVLDKTDAPVNLYCYPNVTGNDYLSLLYARVSAEPNQIHFLSRAGQIPLAERREGFENVIHVHWINELVKAGVTDSEREAFLKLLLEQKSSGFKIYWTIHNYLSHACEDQASEIAFRRALYALCDTVFVHHPLAAYLLDWLPDRSKLAICEHGPVVCKNPDFAEVMALRNRLGLSDTGFVLSCVGQVKPYKGLMNLLPTIYELLVELPKFQFVLAGRIADKEVRDWVASHPHPRLIVLDKFLDDRELECLTLASDSGLLSYQNILTSGAMFHWMSLGRPVLGPRKGLIPPYIVDGWNGYLYDSIDDLAALIRRLSSGDKSLVRDMTKNSGSVADRLVWGRVH